MADRVLSDRYELHEPIGSGPIGEVWRAYDRSLERPVAVKIVRDALSSDDAVMEGLQEAARRNTKLAHPNVVTTYDSWTEEGRLYIAEELVEGVTLREMLHHGPLPAAQTARIARRVLAALDHGHENGVAHADLRPANIFVVRSDDAKVSDFALVQAATAAGADWMLKSMTYSAPELTQGGDATPLSDVYSVGCVLHHCLTGSPPFTADNPMAVAAQHREAAPPGVREVRSDIGEGFEGIVLRALAKDPADRFPSAKRMDAAIAELALDHYQDTPPAFVPPPSRGTVRERIVEEEEVAPAPAPVWVGPLLWGLLGAVLAVLIVLIVVFATRPPDEEQVVVTPEPTPIVVTPIPQQQPAVPPPQPPVIIEQPEPTVIVVTPEPTPPPQEPAP